MGMMTHDKNKMALLETFKRFGVCQLLSHVIWDATLNSGRGGEVTMMYVVSKRMRE